MMKKVVMTALVGASMIATGAQAAVVTSPAGVTFTVGNACTVTGLIVNAGNFTTSETTATYASREGDFDTTAAGSAPAKPLARVNCTAGTPWQLSIRGAGADGDVQVNNPAGTNAFSTIAHSADVDGVASASWLHGTQPWQHVAATGTGVDQTVNGNYFYYRTSDGSSVQALIAGTYTGSSTAELTF